MEYMRLIRSKNERELVQRVAQNDPTLKELGNRLSNDDADALLLALGHALIGNTHLQQLCLRNLPPLTEVTAHALTRGMAQSKIKTLILRDSPKIQPTRQALRVCDIFYRGILASTTIDCLDLDQSMVADDKPGNAWRVALLGVTSIKIHLPPYHHGYVWSFSQVLSRTTLLRDLTLHLDEELEANDINTLARALRQNTSLTSLSLDCDGFDDSQVTQLIFAQGLSPNSAITMLDATEYRDIDDSCVELLVDCWLPNCPMEHLLLSRGRIGPIGVQRLMQAMSNHPTMLELDLSNHHKIGYEGLCMVGNELANLQDLTYLNLKNCSWWDDDLEAESEAAQKQAKACQQAEQALLDGIERNLSIATLNVDENHFHQEVIAEIELYAALNGMGRYLLSAKEDHGVAASVWCHVLAKCQCQPVLGTSLVYFFLKEQPHLVQTHPLLKQKGRRKQKRSLKRKRNLKQKRS